MKQNILLLYPDCPSSYGIPRNPPMGISLLGAILDQDGFNIKIYDLRFKDIDLKKLNNIIDDFNPLFVGISTTSIGFKSTIEICKLVKKCFPHILTLIGGPHPSAYPDYTLKHHEIDYICIGEGDKVILDFARNIHDQSLLRNIPGIGYGYSGEVTKNPQKKFLEDLDALPFPKYELFPIDSYRLKNGDLVLPLLTSRGCPYSCTFCSSYLTNGKKIRERSAKNVVDEIKRNYEVYGSKEFQIVDDTFNFHKERVIDICIRIKKERLNVQWYCGQGIRADRADEEVFKYMKEAGCYLVAIGIETTNPNTLKSIKKGETIEQIRHSIQIAKNVGLITKGFFIIGLPGDRFQDIMESINFFKAVDLDLPRYGMIVNYPGTPMSDWIEKNATSFYDPFEFIMEHTELVGAEAQFETKDFTKEERLRAFDIANKESELWYIQKRLRKMFGDVLGKYFFVPFKLELTRDILKWAYQKKLISVAD